MSQLTAAQIVKKLSKPQRITLPSNRNGWVSGHPATLRSLERLGLIKTAGAGRMRHYVLTIEGEKAADLLYPAQIESDHAEAAEMNKAATVPHGVVEGVTPDGSTLALQRPLLGHWVPVPTGGRITDVSGDVFVVIGAVWRNDIDDRLCIVGHWLGDVIEGRPAENYAMCSQGFNVRWVPKS